MIFCPRCGSPASPQIAHCGVCGAALGPVAKDEAPQRVEPPSGSMKRTMMGVAPGNATAPSGPSGPKAQLKSTMMGVSPLAPGALGAPLPDAPGAPQPAAPAPATNAAAPVANALPPSFKGTMMGVAPNFQGAAPTPAA